MKQFFDFIVMSLLWIIPLIGFALVVQSAIIDCRSVEKNNKEKKKK